MKHKLLLVMGSGLLWGCASTLAPHTPYLPVIRDRGQAEARVSTGLNGSEMQVGYQITDKLVLHAALLDFGAVRPNPASRFQSADMGLGYYYNSPNGIWRLGMHAGAAYGRGNSTAGGCFDCRPDSLDNSSSFAVRYTYGYVQPTVIFQEDDRRTWGLGLRIGQVYYHQLDEVRTFLISRKVQRFDYAGRTSTFIQPTFQYSYKLSRLLTVSGTFGSQTFLENFKAVGGINPLIGQLGVHLTVQGLAKPKP